MAGSGSSDSQSPMRNHGVSGIVGAVNNMVVGTTQAIAEHAGNAYGQYEANNPPQHGGQSEASSSTGSHAPASAPGGSAGGAHGQSPAQGSEPGPTGNNFTISILGYPVSPAQVAWDIGTAVGEHEAGEKVELVVPPEYNYSTSGQQGLAGMK